MRGEIARRLARLALPALLAFAPPALATRGAAERPPAAGEPGGPGLAVLARKALTCAAEGPQVIDHAVLLVKDGRVEAVAPRRSLDPPAGYELLDAGADWIMPGIVDIHSHVAGMSLYQLNDLNDAVYLTNPGLRASAAVIPEVDTLLKAVGGGVTSILYIPGSATNIGGAGVLLKTGLDRYEDMLIRDPGSLKLAQAGNPERWGFGVNRSFMNWHTRHTLKRGVAYAKAWEAYENGVGPKPEKNIQYELIRETYAKRTQVSVHTQIYQVVMTTVTMLAGEFGFDAYIDHGSFDGFKAAPLAEKHGVPAILGPREICATYQGFIDTDGKIVGMAAAYQELGHKHIAFNTDAPIVPEEEVSLQAGMGVRYGMDNTHLESVRGLTIVPAQAAGMDDRVGSLEVRKDADFLVLDGDPADPRTTVKIVFIEGRRVYDNATEPRRW